MKLIFYIVLSFSLLSCAKSYHPIATNYLNFQNEQIEDDLLVSYHYGILKETGNHKYAKKEEAKNVKIVALKITNNSENDIVIGKDKMVYSGKKTITLLKPEFVFKELKQNVPIYLLYLLLTPIQLNITNNAVTNSTPIGLIIGPAITGLNVGIAASANRKFKAELFTHFLNGKTIPAGETITGLIGIAELGYNPLTLK